MSALLDSVFVATWGRRPGLAANARVSNALGDLVLGIGHLTCLVLAVQTQFVLTLRRRRRRHKGEESLAEVPKPASSSSRARRRKTALFWLVASYLSTLATFQLMGLAYHLFNPAPHESDAAWWAYLLAGTLSQGLYGAALSLDVLASFPLTACWLSYTFGYAGLVSLNLDLADYFPGLLPRRLEVSFPAWAAYLCRDLTWMPSALRHNGQAKAGEKALTLFFDGRGYAAVPFDAIFDDDTRHAVDLVAPFPCWRTDSLTLLMLCVGVTSNFCHVAICYRAGWRSQKNQHQNLGRRRRARRNMCGHLFMGAALTTMPAAMLFGGVPAGIDWMHLCAAPAMICQARSCLESLSDDDDHPHDPSVAATPVPPPPVQQKTLHADLPLAAHHRCASNGSLPGGPAANAAEKNETEQPSSSSDKKKQNAIKSNKLT